MNNKIKVKVKPNSSKEKIVKFDSDRYLVYLKQSPKDGKANKRLINLMAKELCTPPGRIRIKRGMTSSNKTLEVR